MNIVNFGDKYGRVMGEYIGPQPSLIRRMVFFWFFAAFLQKSCSLSCCNFTQLE